MRRTLSDRTTADTLESGLEAYSAAVRRPASDWKERLGAWPMYAAVTGAALATATSAHAGIVYSGPQNLAISVPEAGPVNEHGNGTFHILGHLFTFSIYRTLHHISSGSGSKGGRAFIGGSSIVDDNGSRSARRLASGANITAGMPFVGVFGANSLFQHKTGYVGPFRVTGNIGQWLPQDRAFAGLRITTGGGQHLGWVQIQLGDSNHDGFTDHLTIVDWAYNDVAGASISAGDTGLPQAPEPGTKAMTLLALGAAGVVALRKRRQSA